MRTKKKERQRKLSAMTNEERKEFKSKENKRKGEATRKPLSSISKADIDVYRKKDGARKKKTVNPTTPEPTEMWKDVTTLSHCRSKQSYRKALKKGLNSLPSSSRKRTSLIAGSAKRVELNLECRMVKRTRWNPSKEVEGDVENFYFRPDISYTMTGKEIFSSGFQ